MRIRTAAVAALAPVVVATAAQAQVEISNTRTTGVATSTIDSGAAADLVLTQDGSFEMSSGTAITVDSDNALTLESGSDITMDDADDGATAVRLEAGHAGDVSIGGVLALNDGVDAEDEDEDGDLDGPFATGSDRFGLRLTGDGAWTGDITVENTSGISVEGEDSAGVRLDSDLNGSLTVLGGVSAVGDRSRGVDVQGDVSGDVILSGASVTAGGEDAAAVVIDAAVGGRLQVQSVLVSGGYRYTSQPSALADLDEDALAEVEDEDLYLEDLDTEDILQSGSALRVSGGIGGGVLLGVAPSYLSSDGEDGDDDGDGVLNGDEDDDGDGLINSEDDDRDGDGVLDDDEGASSLTTYGSAPALAIGHATKDVTIGLLSGDDAGFGLANHGSILGTGVYGEIDATGALIGGGTGVTRIEGGVWNAGTITASASEASATGLRFGDGAVTARLENSGTIYGVASTEGADAVTAVQIDAGASLPSFANSGYLTAAVYGEAADAVAVRDDSGTLTGFINTGRIAATITATDNDADDETSDETVTGRAIAMDLSANMSGVVVRQYGESDMSATDADGDGVYDAADEDDDDDGVLDADDADDNDDDNDGVYDSDEPYILGDVLLGSGDDSLLIENGYVIGTVSFGAGADVLSVTNGTLLGPVTDADGRLSVVVEEGGVLDARQDAPTRISDLNVGSGGMLVVAIDSDAGAAGGFDVTGTASFADDSIIAVHLNALVGEEAERYALVTAGSLELGSLDESGVEAATPYMTLADYGADGNTVYVDIRRRTPSEMALLQVEGSQYDAFYDALSRDEDVMAAFLATTTREAFVDLYEQTLPDHSGGTLTVLSEGVDLVSRALSERNANLARGETSGWVQQLNYYDDKDRTDTYGYRSEGLAIAGGAERGGAVGVIGMSVGLSTADLKDPEAEAEEVLSATLLELGLYWRAQGHGWNAWARTAVGYAMFDSKRALVGQDIYLANEARWDGYTLAAAAGLSYTHDFGRFRLSPTAYVDWFSLHESSRTEDGGGDAFDLQIDDREGSLARATAALKISYALGRDRALRPELTLGWRQMLSADYGETVARYVSGGSDFILAGEAITGGGPLVGMGLTLGNDLGRVAISGDAQLLEDSVRCSLLLSASFRF